jgi:catechol 2,3-dioxygenase-like lactoylglutathione lyase family enzyme
MHLLISAPKYVLRFIENCKSKIKWRKKFCFRGTISVKINWIPQGFIEVEIEMRLKNILFVVNDIKKSKDFYRELFGLEVIADFGENVVLTEGLALQERKLWETFIEKDTVLGGNDAELYFEDNDIDRFLQKLENSSFPIEYLNKCKEHDWGQRVIRIYDPDKHVIEIGESMEYVARRFLNMGMTVEQVAKKTQLPLSQIEVVKTDF